MRPLALTRRGLAGAAAAALAAAVLVVVAPSPVAQAAPGDVVLTGHGFGHGRGLSQWGAYGYATRFGSNHLQILEHYYSNTTAGSIGNPAVTVHLTARDGVALAVTSSAPVTVGGLQYAGGTAVEVARAADGTWRLTTRSGCAGPVTGTSALTDPTVRTVGDPGDDLGGMLTFCGGERRTYRGALSLVWDGGSLRTVNTVLVQDYLRGVVPREAPPAWGDAAAGAGTNALMAQAVAARSYAMAENRQPWARTCDTTACQVYGGAGLDGARLEDARTDRAVAATAGQVRMLAGAPARTEFSSSSGGWTAGGTFPAVRDDGDVASPYHDWTATVPAATVSAAFGVGPLQAVQVLSRNGLGAEGGRVLSVRVTGTAATVTVTGEQFRTALGLRSAWFSVGAVQPAYDPRRDDLSPVGVAAVRTAAGTVLAFVRGTDGAVWVSTATNGSFGPFGRIPSRALGGPAAVSSDGSRVDLFVRGADRAVWHTSTVVDAAGRPTTFAPWQSLGGILTTAPAAASAAAGRLVVAGRGTDGAMYSRAFDGTAWSPWQVAGGLAIAAPALDVGSSGGYRLTVVGTDGAAWSRELGAGGAPTAGWTTSGLRSTAAVGASGTTAWAREIRALAYNTPAGIRQVWAGGTVVDLGGIVTSGTALVEWGSTSTWTFGRGTDAALWLGVTTGSGASSAWYRIGGVLA